MDFDVFGVGDLEGLLAVTASAAWLHTADDWRAMLHAGTVFGHRSGTGEIVSTTAVVSYGTTLSSIGMVIVKPEWRGRSLATALMQHALASCLASVRPAVLIATPFGYPLYQRLGFKTIAHVCRMTATKPPPARLRAPTGEIDFAPLSDAERAMVYELDAAVMGLGRSRVLEARAAYSRRTSVLRRRDGTIVGFALATPQRDLLSIGPVIAPDADGAGALIGDVAADHAGPIRVDVPTDQAALMTSLTAAGFTAADEAPLMMYGGERLPGDRRRLFAIASRGFC
jgi:GNAT superfamily N-acetyltransferase